MKKYSLLVLKIFFSCSEDPDYQLWALHVFINRLVTLPKMDFFFSQKKESFDVQKEIVEDERWRKENGCNYSPHSHSISLFKPTSSKGEWESPHLVEQVPTMRLLPSTTKKSYITIKTQIEDVNKIASCLAYNILMNKRNTKNKNVDLQNWSWVIEKRVNTRKIKWKLDKNDNKEGDSVRLALPRLTLYEKMRSSICELSAQSIIIFLFYL